MSRKIALDAVQDRTSSPEAGPPQDNDAAPEPDLAALAAARGMVRKTGECLVPAGDERRFHIPAQHFFRVTSLHGAQVGDLNLWSAEDPRERLCADRTRARHGMHLTRGHRLWSGCPIPRPLATVTGDTLDWYGIDPQGGSVHDVTGPCCGAQPLPGRGRKAPAAQEPATAALPAQDVLHLFRCSGFTRDTGRYFTKPSPVQPGDHVEFLAEIELICALSACPGGDCGAGPSGRGARCHPLLVEIFAPREPTGL
ncbi:urea carboxylase-associated family protein [Paracoccus aminovorans]|uniref:urea carboxylase-associated family protein n=1 Tax=Paracoccus aminovorans TaxID=34004 RepID=UPI002B25D7AD|nr:urea carboxylase-associated family protein [Paracoccus aminovorans]